MTKTRLLIVDDNPVIRQGLRSLLEAEEQLEVSGEASTGAEAVQWIKKHSADVILMDIRMPIIDGIDATTEILRSHPQAKILILTVTEDPKTLARTLHAGARGYFVYSRFAPDELLNAVYTVASGEEIAPSPAVALALGELPPDDRAPGRCLICPLSSRSPRGRLKSSTSSPTVAATPRSRRFSHWKRRRSRITSRACIRSSTSPAATMPSA